ncbi:MAG: hypothetical protein GXO62_05180 [Epsilonproteobacteria bacterium]|nr:hypothetical protein [Campylobacterota bacterium]
MSLLKVSAAALFLLGCGYKPSSYYQNKILTDNIKTKIQIDVKNPRETIFFKDALNDAVYATGKEVCKSGCDSVIEVKDFSTSLSPLDYDANGFPILYRAEVNLKADVVGKNLKKRYNVSGKYDFSISSNSILTDQTKLEAYKKAMINALNKLFAKITKDGALL